MRICLLATVVFGVALGVAAAQDAPVSPSQSSPQMGQRGGGRGRGMGMGGGGIMGTVTEAGSDHYTIKTDAGETYTVHFSANTHILKQTAGQGQGRGQGGSGMGMGGNPPEPIKASEIKVGDMISAMGDTDASTKSVGAMAVVLMSPERAKQLREMQANFGKTWLMGKVTAINELTVTLTSGVDNAAHAFTADENTTFRKRRDPITLADIQPGDSVRVEGAIKNGAFVASSVMVMGNPGGPRGGGSPDAK
jgi:preprotein translocase subunit YajC